MREIGLALLAAASCAALSGCGQRADTLPRTRNAGSLAVTLTAVRPAREDPTGSHPYQAEAAAGAGVSWHEDAPQHGGRRDRVLEACFELTEAGRPTDDWRLTHATVTGSRGRAIQDAIRQQQWAPEGRQFAWLEGPRAGRVWRVVLGFCAADSYQGFGQDQLWTVRGLAVPRGRSVTTVSDTRAKIGGATLELVALVPPGRTTYRRGAVSEFETVPVSEGMSVSCRGQDMVVAASRTSVVVTVDHKEPEQQLSVRAQDDHRRECRQVSACQGDGPRSGDTLHVMTLDVPTDARALDLTFILQKARTVEFVVRRP